MASGAHHCKDCGTYFDSSQSLEVHLQYHKENLMNMWMGEDRTREGGIPSVPTTSSGELTQTRGDGDPNSLSSGPSAFVKEEPSPSFIGPPPVSPMEYDFKTSPGLSSPQSYMVPQGPASGSNSSVSFPQQSPGSYYSDFNPLMQHQNALSYANYQPAYTSGFDDQFYCRGGNNSAPRYHPYIGRSPVPTPSPGASMSDIKDEPRSTPHTPEILDLDSQEVLNSASQQNLAPLPPMWRPHEQFPSPSSMPNGTCPPAIGLGASPTTGLGSNQSSLGPNGLGSSSMGMLPPMQQPAYSAHSISTPVAPTAQTVSGGYRANSSGASYYPQGLSISSGLSNNNPANFTASVSAPSPSRDAPAPSEYPSNVKRAKSFKCEDCNKWFTSHGHLKRHYNTTLHKNMTKVNNSTPTSTQSISSDITRPPIVSPSAKSIGESSTTSSHDEESNISSSDGSDTTFQAPGSAFQPPINNTRFDIPGNIYSGPPPGAVGHMNPAIPPQPQHFLGNQSLTHHPTMYHGHFSTNPTSYPHQAPHTIPNNPFFCVTSNFCHPPQGGQHGPGFHSMNDFPGPNPEVYNAFRIENSDRAVPQSISSTGDSTTATSPDIVSGDTGSEASMDSSESERGPIESNFRCNDCSKTFNKMCYLTQHRSTYHEGEKPFKCGTCGKRFPDEVIFNDHQSKHAGEKPYKCEVCPKQFNHKTDLRRHMCLHTGEKPFSCEQCGKGFIRKDHMLKHFQTHRKKAMAAANHNNASHPSMPPNRPGLAGHHGFSTPHAPISHPSHGSRRHPHVVAPPVY